MNERLQKILYFPITKIIVCIAVCFSLFVGAQNLVLKPLFYSFIPDQDLANPFIHIISCFVLLFSYYFFFRFYDKREIKELSVKHLAKEMFGGFAVGFLTISLAILILYVLGYYHVIEMSTAHYPIRLFTTLVVAALIEDLFHRGLIFREMEKWLGTHIALLIVMLVETSHFFNPHANLFTLFTDLCWGFTLSMLFVYTRRLWLTYFFHLGWNFAQPFYGSNLTGLNNLGTIIKSRFEGPVLLTGGDIGIEGSVITVLFLIAIGIFLYYKARKEGKIIKRKTIG
ncbi:CPBP family intramembrane glutamic endopeptidase [Flavobacterium sp. N1718]|uniref:CPBP family intramembrane glutamic endopeptidase n=1 Tax=Flavobacterium sp. N1718 TaxID=2986822 RepID=UPI002224FB7B|nr:type II CAAX endopeptidase family protein [Flavobacterium sp. N1718]